MKVSSLCCSLLRPTLEFSPRIIPQDLNWEEVISHKVSFLDVLLLRIRFSSYYIYIFTISFHLITFSWFCSVKVLLMKMVEDQVSGTPSLKNSQVFFSSWLETINCLNLFKYSTLKYLEMWFPISWFYIGIHMKRTGWWWTIQHYWSLFLEITLFNFMFCLLFREDKGW